MAIPEISLFTGIDEPTKERRLKLAANSLYYLLASIFANKEYYTQCGYLFEKIKQKAGEGHFVIKLVERVSDIYKEIFKDGNVGIAKVVALDGRVQRFIQELYFTEMTRKDTKLLRLGGDFYQFENDMFGIDEIRALKKILVKEEGFFNEIVKEVVKLRFKKGV